MIFYIAELCTFTLQCFVLSFCHKQLKNSILGKALQYAKNQKVYLMNYLEDGECQLSNNLAERSIRPFVVGRKAWNFSTSTKGATASGVVYSLIQTAKLNGLDPYKHLNYLFEELPDTPFKEYPELLQGLLPWSQKFKNSVNNPHYNIKTL